MLLKERILSKHGLKLWEIRHATRKINIPTNIRWLLIGKDETIYLDNFTSAVEFLFD